MMLYSTGHAWEQIQFVVDHYISLLLTVYIAVSVTPKSPKLGEPSTPRTDHSQVEVHVTQKQPVDEDHPTVQELVEAGYNVEQSIEAVEHSEKLEEAMDYLLSLGGEGGIFQASTSVLAEEKHQYWEQREAEFMEESQQERPLYAVHLYCPSSSLTANTFLSDVIATHQAICVLLDWAHFHIQCSIYGIDTRS